MQLGKHLDFWKLNPYNKPYAVSFAFFTLIARRQLLIWKLPCIVQHAPQLSNQLTWRFSLSYSEVVYSAHHHILHWIFHINLSFLSWEKSMQVLHFVLLGRQLQVCLLSVLISPGLWEFKHLVFFPFEQQQGYLEF